MNYYENYHGIQYDGVRNCDLLIRASYDDFHIYCINGVLNLMSRDGIGRTALFVNDCDFYKSKYHWNIVVKIGTPSYIKELASLRKVSGEEYKLYQFNKLW